jgi:hypothetical protein
MRDRNNPISPAFVPLIDRVRTTTAKVVVVLVGIVLCMAIGAVVDKAFAVPIEDSQYHYSNHRASLNRMVTVKTWQTNQYGQLVPRYVHGHAYCKYGYYPVFSRYTGTFCEDHKADRRLTKAVIKCGAYVVVGRYFGGVAGGRAAAAGCGIDFLL